MTSVRMQHILSSSFEASDLNGLQKDWKDLKGDDDNKRVLLETTFRSFLTDHLINESKIESPDLAKCQRFVDFGIQASRVGICAPTLPILLLTDLFDLLTLDHSQILFASVEDNVKIWKEDQFFAIVKNHLLRICNDLLRRLSRTQNTVFCGRILLFLAKFFPISERSGLNVISEFNLENTTTFSEEDIQDDTAVKDSIIIEEDQKNLNIDYSLYKKFWQLQDFFRNPTQCYNKEQWKTFSTYSNDVLGTFKSFKLDSIAGKKKAVEGSDQKEEQYFAKYLTNQNLLQLQLSDSNFRRYILTQFLILFQYLQSSVKFKNDTDVLTDEQSKWVKKATEQVYDLIKETPPNGAQFAKSVKHILQREEQWISWKNEGCPSFKPRVSPAAASLAKDGDDNNKPEANGKPAAVGSTRKRKRKVGDQIQDAIASKKFLMGNATLTRLWNKCPDNMEACSAPERDFLPELGTYFLEAIEQINPASGIDAEYKKINDGSWGWRALRLMAKRSPHFFTYGNHPIAKLPDYLESMLWKMCKDPQFTSSGSEELARITGEAVEAQNRLGETSVNGKDKENGSGGGGEGDATQNSNVCTHEQLEKLAEKLDDKWVKLFPKLGLDKEVKEEIENDHKEARDRCFSALTKWAAAEGEGATHEEIVYILEGLKMADLAGDIFKSKQ